MCFPIALILLEVLTLEEGVASNATPVREACAACSAATSAIMGADKFESRAGPV